MSYNVRSKVKYLYICCVPLFLYVALDLSMVPAWLSPTDSTQLVNSLRSTEYLTLNVELVHTKYPLSMFINVSSHVEIFGDIVVLEKLSVFNALHT